MYLPKATKDFYDTPCEEGVYRGKKVLAVHGSVDKIMPFSLGEEKWPRLRGELENYDVYIEEGFGHVVTPGMVRVTAEWLWRWGLTEDK